MTSGHLSYLVVTHWYY